MPATKILYPEDEKAFVAEHPLAFKVVLPGGLPEARMLPVEADKEIWWLIPRETREEEIDDIRGTLAGACTFVALEKSYFFELDALFRETQRRMKIHQPQTWPEFLKGSSLPSLLSPELEKKRRAIAREHIRVTIWLLLFGILLGIAAQATATRWEKYLGVFGYGILTSTPLVIIVVLLVSFRLDEWLCRKYDFFCPHCKKSLYFDNRGGLLLNAICPRCKEDLDPNPLPK